MAEVRSIEPEMRLASSLAALHTEKYLYSSDLGSSSARVEISAADDSGKMIATFELLDSLLEKQEKCIVF